MSGPSSTEPFHDDGSFPASGMVATHAPLDNGFGTEDWRPTASLATLKLRARLLARIRAFFEKRQVLEVETPLLASAAVTDRHITSLETRCRVGERLPRRLYLQTSPESAMKRLLAAGSGPIFQICKAFRDDEMGCLHNPEFTLLEWYRPGFDHHALMSEIDQLMEAVLGIGPASRLGYAQALRQWAGLDPHDVSLRELRRYTATLGLSEPAAVSLDRDACLDLIVTRVVQPRLGKGATFIYHYPASQASLARIRSGCPPVAERFELFINGIELANGYHELVDASEQRQRLLADLERRRQRGLPDLPLDERLLNALAYGLPDCAGVALGIDRLVMLAAGAETLEEVIPFPVSRA